MASWFWPAVHPRFCSDHRLCYLWHLLGSLILACWALTPISPPETDANLRLAPICSSSPSYTHLALLFTHLDWPPKAPGWFKSLFYLACPSACHEGPVDPEHLSVRLASQGLVLCCPLEAGSTGQFGRQFPHTVQTQEKH